MQAQIEHRKRYPDWRFRPSANAAAKLLKVKDGPPRKNPPRTKAQQLKTTNTKVATKKRRAAAKDGKNKDGGEVEMSGSEARCAKIADFLTEGMKGADLVAAVKRWDDNRSGDEGVVVNPPTITSVQPTKSISTGHLAAVVQAFWQPEKPMTVDTSPTRYSSNSPVSPYGSPNYAPSPMSDYSVASPMYTSYSPYSPSSMASTPEMTTSPTISEAEVAECDHRAFPLDRSLSPQAFSSVVVATQDDNWCNVGISSLSPVIKTDR